MPAPRIDKSVVERMLLAYLKDPNPTRVARDCDVSWQTAKKYIQEGAPALGIGPFSSEARRLLRNGDKLIRLTEVTREIRYQVEERDLGAFQDMLFEFEHTIRECLGLVKARAIREKEHFIRLEEAKAAGAPQDLLDKITPPRMLNVSDLKGLSTAMHELHGLKREFWDRIEVVRSTTVDTTAADEGIIDTAAEVPPIDFSTWEPHEIAEYIDSVDEGKDPVYPAWMEVDPTPNQPSNPDEGAKDISDKNGPESLTLTDLVRFPPAATDPQSDDL